MRKLRVPGKAEAKRSKKMAETRTKQILTVSIRKLRN